MNGEIEVCSIRKTYPLYKKKSDKLKEAFSLRSKSYHRDFEAVKNVSFSVAKGECVGIIGLNGSGKSTLLKMLSGVIKPTSGEAKIHGSVASLLELGAGFNPEYSGMENIYLNTLLMGYTREETNKKLDEILEFADIGDFIYQPVKIYSSGMFVRLAFAIYVTVEPDVLIIDEALSVGDVFFQQKCYNKIKELASKCTVLIVSHDLNSLTKFCKRILVMNHGELIYDGKALAAIREYYKIKQGSVDNNEDDEPVEIENNSKGMFVKPDFDSYSGALDIIIESYYYQINKQAFSEYCEAGKTVHVSMQVYTKTAQEDIIVGYQVRDKYGNEVFGETNITSDVDATTSLKPGRSIISFSFKWPEIREGDYFITLGIGVGKEVLRQVEQCWINQAIHIVNTTHEKLIYGIFNNNMENFSIREGE